MADNLIQIQSSGLGVQSMALSLMSFKGILPPLDHIIFSDTGWENDITHDCCEFMKHESKKYGVEFHVVNNGSIYKDAVRNQSDGEGRWASMPYHTLDRNAPANKQKGMVRRQCTSEYKITAIDRFIKREILGIAPRKWAPRTPVVNKWFGISMDEAQRMRAPANKWEAYSYPLIYDVNDGFGINREGCSEWLTENYPDLQIARSSCIGCPFHSDEEWRWVRDTFPAKFEEACQFDELIRHREGMRSESFLHTKRIPLREVDLDKKTDGRQPDLFGNECTGMCGV